jgi:biofilm PGA synthesis N-glycosyltransferase PgaC
MILPGAFSGFRAPLLKSMLLSLRSRLDETLAEDFDITIRVWKRGMRTAYLEDAVAYTAIPGSLKGLYIQRVRWFAGGLQVLVQHLRLFRYRKRHVARRSANRLILHLLAAEYLLPLLHVAGYIMLPTLLILQALLKVNILPLSWCILANIILATYITSIIMGSGTVILAVAAVHGFRAALRFAPYAVIYTALYLPLLSIAKADSMIRALQRMHIRWR